jgi:monoamine oxidase
MSESEVLIIGGGVAGLTAARDLTRAGGQVTLIEARERLGGRILTDHSLGYPVELGAEFVHGRPPETWELAEAAGLHLLEVSGHPRTFAGGRWFDSGKVMHEVNQIFERMSAVSADMSFQQYVEKQRDISSDGIEQARKFVEGFHAANPERVSVEWLRQTANAEDEIDGAHSFRVSEGYERLVETLKNQIDMSRCDLCINTEVKEIHWSPHSATAVTVSGEIVAPKAIITLPLTLLKAGAVRFAPELPQEKRDAMQHLETGPVIRVSLCFRERFWENRDETRESSFLFTDDPSFPTWWTSNPLQFPMLTAWAAGRYALALQGASHEQMIETALQSLSSIMTVTSRDLVARLERGFVHDWQADPFSRGAYSYVAVGGAGAERVLAEPVLDTLFFAGEATHPDGHNGTVHGAIATGIRAAKECLQSP